MSWHEHGAHAIECWNGDPADRKLNPPLPELLDEAGDAQRVAAETSLVRRACQRTEPSRCKTRLHDPL